MQGFILNLNKVKDEDLIVTILGKNHIYTLYRFYGARHGTINLGFKLDFEVESSYKVTISRLKDVIHIGYKWINNHQLLKLWQDFTHLFYKHLREVEGIDEFYFNLIEEASKQWNKQNPKRVAIECYVKLLEYEGRLHTEKECFLCGTKIKDEVSLIRAFLPTHKECSHTLCIDNYALKELFKNKSSIFLNDIEVDRLWYVLMEGF